MIRFSLTLEKLSIVSYLLLFAANGCSKSIDQTDNGELKAVFEQDLGKIVVPVGLPIDQTNLIEHSFEITNTSQIPLDLQAVYKSCSCIEHSIEPSTIAPGERGAVHLKFSYGSKDEVLGYSLLTSTNHTNPKEIEFVVSARVIPSIQLIDYDERPVLFAKNEVPQTNITLLLSRYVNDEITVGAMPTFEFDSKQLIVVPGEATRETIGQIEQINLPLTVSLDPVFANRPIETQSQVLVGFGSSKMDFSANFAREDFVKSDVNRIIFSRTFKGEKSFVLTGKVGFTLGDIEFDGEVFDLAIKTVTDQEKRIAVKLRNKFPSTFESTKYDITVFFKDEREPIQIKVFVL